MYTEAGVRNRLLGYVERRERTHRGTIAKRIPPRIDRCALDTRLPRSEPSITECTALRS